MVGVEPGTDGPLAPPEPFERSPDKKAGASTGSHARENVKVRVVDNNEISLLLEQFWLYHGQGKLEDAVEVLETVLSFMERKNSQQGQVRTSGLSDDWSSSRSEKDDWVIARVMNDLGCTLQQVHQYSVSRRPW